MKRWIHATIDEGYTELISEETPEVVDKFLNLDVITLDDLSIAADAVEAYMADFTKFPKMNTMDSLDIKYDEDHKRFYKKWKPFAKKCEYFARNISPSGYGKNDYFFLKLRDKLKWVDYNFPYGWK